MTKYIASLRAINVGRHAIIKMEGPKRMFESFGLEDVQTYIQSGNIIFESKEDDTALLEKRVGNQLEERMPDVPSLTEEMIIISTRRKSPEQIRRFFFTTSQYPV